VSNDARRAEQWSESPSTSTPRPSRAETRIANHPNHRRHHRLLHLYDQHHQALWARPRLSIYRKIGTIIATTTFGTISYGVIIGRL